MLFRSGGNLVVSIVESLECCGFKGVFRMWAGLPSAAAKALLRMFPISNLGQVVLAEVRLIRGRGVPRPHLCAQRGLTLDAPADIVPRPRLGARRVVCYAFSLCYAPSPSGRLFSGLMAVLSLL